MRRHESLSMSQRLRNWAFRLMNIEEVIHHLESCDLVLMNEDLPDWYELAGEACEHTATYDGRLIKGEFKLDFEIVVKTNCFESFETEMIVWRVEHRILGWSTGQVYFKGHVWQIPMIERIQKIVKSKLNIYINYGKFC